MKRLYAHFCIQVGFNAGDGVNFYSVPGSMTDSMLNLPHMSNIGVPGQFVFRVDQSKIANAGNYPFVSQIGHLRIKTDIDHIFICKARNNCSWNIKSRFDAILYIGTCNKARENLMNEKPFMFLSLKKLIFFLNYYIRHYRRMC